MLELIGGTRIDYFHVECVKCHGAVELSDLRWVGGVPQLKATCTECRETSDFKLHPTTWKNVVPPRAT
jgi:hypothetical protein